MPKHELLRRMRKNKFFIAGSVMVLLLIIALLVGSRISPFDPTQTNLKERLVAPEWLANGLNGHVLGTDPLGQDILARLLHGGQLSLVIALLGVALPSIIGTLLGLWAGYYGKKVDLIIMRICEVQLSLPTTILAICLMAILGAKVSNLIIVNTLTSWVQYCRMARSTVLSLRSSEFVSASKVLGASNRHIILKQVLPNVLTPLIIIASQSFGFMVLNEASLSFLGCGIPITTPSWGGMISAGRQYLETAPWTVIAPGLALMYTVLAFNFLGDGVRDILDPRNKD